jgi:hypothetical protein
LTEGCIVDIRKIKADAKAQLDAAERKIADIEAQQKTAPLSSIIPGKYALKEAQRQVDLLDEKTLPAAEADTAEAIIENLDKLAGDAQGGGEGAKMDPGDVREYLAEIGRVVSRGGWERHHRENVERLRDILPPGENLKEAIEILGKMDRKMHDLNATLPQGTMYGAQTPEEWETIDFARFDERMRERNEAQRRGPGRPHKGEEERKEKFFEEGKVPDEWDTFKTMDKLRGVWTALNPKDTKGATFRAQLRTGTHGDYIKRILRSGKPIPGWLAVRREWHARRVMKNLST